MESVHPLVRLYCSISYLSFFSIILPQEDFPCPSSHNHVEWLCNFMHAHSCPDHAEKLKNYSAHFTLYYHFMDASKELTHNFKVIKCKICLIMSVASNVSADWNYFMEFFLMLKCYGRWQKLGNYKWSAMGCSECLFCSGCKRFAFSWRWAVMWKRILLGVSLCLVILKRWTWNIWLISSWIVIQVKN